MVTVDEVLIFVSQNPNKDRCRIVSRFLTEDKPRPPLRNLRSMDVTTTADGQKQVLLTIFDVSTYDQVEWMTGCEKRQSLFCWPCLLFSHVQSPWITKGVSQLNCLRDTLSTHEKQISHIRAMLEWKLARPEPKPQMSVDVIEQNELIKRNREILTRIIDAVCTLVMQLEPPHGSSAKNQLKVQECLEMMSLLREYDHLHNSIIDDALDVMQITPTIVNDIVDSITDVVKASVQKEMQQSSYVSVILSEHSDDLSRSQISTVVRYLKQFKVCERFLGFTNPKNDKTDQSPLAFVKKVVDAYQISSRLIGISMDGSPITFNKHKLHEFKSSFRSHYPYTFFVPCYFHKLEYVLQQSLSRFKEFDCFFQHLKLMSAFFIEDSMVRKEFESFENGLLVDIEIFESMKYPELFEIVKGSRNIFLQFFQSVLKNPEKWKCNHIVKAMSFRNFLMNFKTVFLLEVFIKLYGLLRNFCDALSSNTPETVFHNHVITDLQQNFQYVRDNCFEELWNRAVLAFAAFVSDDVNQAKKQENEKPLDKTVYRAMFLDIVVCFKFQLNTRFELPLNWEFFHILNQDTYINGNLTENLKQLMVHGSLFNPPKMHLQLHSLDKVLKPGCKSVYKLLQFFGEHKNIGPFEDLYKLSELILSLPCKPPSEDGGPTKLDEIIPWTSSVRKEFAGDTSVLCVERDYFLELRNRPSFYDDVIAHFHEKNKTMELVYHR